MLPTLTSIASAFHIIMHRNKTQIAPKPLTHSLTHSLDRIALESRCARLTHNTVTCSFPACPYRNLCVGPDLDDPRRAWATTGAVPICRDTTFHGRVSPHLEGHVARNICWQTDDIGPHLLPQIRLCL